MISQMAYLPPSLLDKIVAYLRKIDKMNLQVTFFSSKNWLIFLKKIIINK